MAKKILHIEDDRNVLALVKIILEKPGYQFLSALDAMQGLMMVRQHQPDLIILDIMMPAGGGVSVYERIRMLASTTHIPVLIYTAAPRGELEGKIAFGSDTLYLQKPASPADILKAVDGIFAAS
jgi:DNA-binding response OmpR family regulator